LNPHSKIYATSIRKCEWLRCSICGLKCAHWHFGTSLANCGNDTEWQENEDRYLKIVSEIGGKKGADLAAESLSIFGESMLENPCDFLGQFYMSHEMGNERAGQFFTPYSVSKMLSGITVEEAKEKINKFSSFEVLSINDPTCGAGGMLVAATDHLFFEADPVSVDKVFFVGQDIDRRCFYMAYMQLCTIGCMGLVILGNTLNNTRDRVWETPSSAYFCGYERWQMMSKIKNQAIEMEPTEPTTEQKEESEIEQESSTNEEIQFDLFV